MENLITLGLLIILQAVLGFDNLLYISIESKRAPLEKQKMVRQWGIGLAIFLRIILLFILIQVIQHVQDPWITLDTTAISGSISIHSLIVLFGGIFIVYTAMKEIWHMLSTHEEEEKDKASTTKVITMIVLMNLVFSFDSILSAMALSDIFWIMATAIIVSGILMIWLAERVSEFLHKNRMYEVLGLFILFVVGIMLITEGGHIAHLKLFGNEITPMSKTTFYFVITILVLTDIVQSQYKKKLLKRKG